MRTASAAALLLLLQTGPPTADRANQLAPLRLERPIVLGSNAAGPACAVLDAAVFAHMDARSGADLRLFARHDAASSAWKPAPFALTESSAADEAPGSASVRNAKLEGNSVSFDLTMPDRPYSQVDLDLNEKNFIAIATVSGERNQNAPQSLGTFTLFDLSGEGLARSSTLALAETTFPHLHLNLRFFRPDGKPLTLASNPVASAEVPPSREAQTLYTTVAATNTFTQKGADTVAQLDIPAQVPVERVVITLAPGFHGSFLRTANLFTETLPEPQPTSGITSFDRTLPLHESISGSLWRIERSAHGAAPALDSEHLAFDAVLGANLRAPAHVTIGIPNGTNPPLPLSSIALQMRQRRLCFNAAPDTGYLLAYGDPAMKENSLNLAVDGPAADIGAPLALSSQFHPGAFAAHALLGPEQRNPRFIAPAHAPAHRLRFRLEMMLAIIAILLLALAGSRGRHEPGER